MLKLALAGGLLLLAGCATSPEVTLLMGPRIDNQLNDTEFGATLIILQQIGQSRVRCGAVHSSTVENGKPFHPDRREATFDHAACGLRFGGNAR